MRHAIIGAGPAGVVAAEQIKSIDSSADVVLIGDEAELPYSRMAIPYLLSGRIGEAGTHLRKEPYHYSSLGIELRQGRVLSVDSANNTLSMEGGGSIEYDRLLIATGSSPWRPDVPGINNKGVLSCWNLEDAREIANRCTRGSEVVIIGSGFIGSIILEAMVKMGVKVTVVASGNRMVRRMMNDTAGGMIQRWCEANGVKVVTEARLEAINGGGRGFFNKIMGTAKRLQVVLSGGRQLSADLVICATGVVANTGFLAGSGVEVDQGILVNRQMQSSVPNIYAAGDVCQGADFSTGSRTVQAVQPTAADHGRIAASNMVGTTVEHQGCVNMNVLDTMGLVTTSFGLWMGVDGGESCEASDPSAGRYINLQFEGDVLVGATTIGLTQHVGVLRGLIQSRTNLNGWKSRLMSDPTRVTEAYIGSTQAIGANSARV